jgi:hypothetical protein
MHDDPIVVLERELVAAARRRVVVIDERAGSQEPRGPWPSAPRPARRRSSLGAFAAVALSGVAVLVALGALVTLRGHTPARRAAATHPSATHPPAATPGRQQLIDILGVLRRRQTKADLSPWVQNTLRGQLFGPPDVALVRRVGVTPWGSGVVLIPTKPSPARFPFPARTEEGIDLEVDGGGGCCATAATIAASGDISIDGAGRAFAGGSTQTRFTVLVPDGVASVQFLLPHPPNPAGRVHDNVAAVQVYQGCCTGGVPMIWRAADGHVIKRLAGAGAAGRPAPPPRPGPETALSRAAERNPSTPNRVWVTPAVGGPRTNFKVHLHVLLKNADYSYALTGTRCPGITLNGGDGGGTNDVRGHVWTDVVDTVAGQAWCPGSYNLSVTFMDLGRYGQLKQPARPFGSATFTVKP